MHVWIAARDGTVRCFEASTRVLEAEGGTGHPVSCLAVSGAGIWAVGGGRRGRATLLSADTLTVLRSVAVGPFPIGIADAGTDAPIVLCGGRRPALVRPGESGRCRVGRHTHALAAGFGSLWIARQSRPALVERVDPATGDVTGAVAVQRDPQALVCGHDSVWVATDAPGGLARIDPSTMEVSGTVEIPRQPSALCEAFGAVWITHGSLPQLTMVPLDSPDSVATVRVGSGSFGIAAGAGDLWLAQTLASKVAVVDPLRRGVRDRIEIGEPLAVVAA